MTKLLKISAYSGHTSNIVLKYYINDQDIFWKSPYKKYTMKNKNFIIDTLCDFLTLFITTYFLKILEWMYADVYHIICTTKIFTVRLRRHRSKVPDRFLRFSLVIKMYDTYFSQLIKKKVRVKFFHGHPPVNLKLN